MSKRGKVSAKWFSALVVILNVFIITFSLNAKHGSSGFYCDTENPNDTTPPKKKPPQKNLPQLKTDTTRKAAADTTKKKARTDSSITTTGDTIKRKDTGRIIQKIDTFDFKISPDTLQGEITYEAEDSGVLLIPTKQFILYGKAATRYTDLELNAATIKLDQDKHIITAYGSKDTLGNPLDKPKLVQGETTSNSDTIVYNLKTQKGLTKGSYLQEGEMYVYANTVKKVSNDVLYAWRGRFTTCNLDTPHFAFRTRKMKIINKKLAISGPAFPEFEGVPIPIGIPFGIYPLNRGRHSGILAPTFEANDDFGLGLINGGFYKVMNDYWDVTLRSNIYSYGGWNLNASSRYTRRYRYNGGINLSVQNTKILNRSGNIKEEFTTNKSFMIGWNHSRDAKAHPGTNFSASVNAGSTKFNRYVPNNANLNFQNQLSSSINYSKDWRGKYNLSISANHNQNNYSRLINLNLPSVNFSMLTLYPFQPKEQVGESKWYEKLGIGYSGSFQNQFAFYDSAFSIRRLLDTAQWSATHSIPITLSLPQLGPVQISPGVSYSERWFGQAITAEWDTINKAVVQKTTRGFYTERQTNFSLSANTRIFGTYQFGKGSHIQAIRHEIRPNLSFNYTPDLNKGNSKAIRVDTTGSNFLTFSTITGSQLTGDRRFGGISFGVDNTLEMKVRNKKDTAADAFKKVRLIDGFGFNGSYNLIIDSFKLSPISLNFRNNLFEKINITATATLDPYKVNAQGFRIDEYMWQGNKFSLGRITDAQIAMSTSFQSKAKDGKTDAERLPKDEFMTPDEQQRQLDYVRSNPAEYTDFNIPWSVSLSYSLNLRRFFIANGFKTEINSNVSVNGDFSLTPRWKMGGSTYFDFRTKEIQTLTMFISREMHCWQMSINLTPVGLYRSFNITINPKSGILRDLRINRAKGFYNQ